jgi:hypothetical protein
MKKLLSVLALFALLFTSVTQVQAFEPQAFDQATALRDAERFLKGLGYNPTSNQINDQANAFFYAYRQGTLGNLTYNPDNEYVIDLIFVNATQAQIDLEKSVLENLWREGLKVHFRISANEVEVGLNSVSVQELVSQASFTAYAAGFADGQTQTTGSSVNALASFIPQVLGVGFGFFLQIASFEVLGVSLLSVVAMMVGLTGLLITLKVATGGR